MCLHNNYKHLYCSRCVEYLEKFEIDNEASIIFEDREEIHTASRKHDSKDYDSVKDRFERSNFKCKSAFFCLHRGTGKWDRYNKSDFITKEEHVQYEETVYDRRTKKTGEGGSLVNKSFVTAWMKDERIRKYDSVLCLPPPHQVDEHVFNLWTGFPIMKIPLPLDVDCFKPDLDRILDHLLAVASDDQHCFQYLLNWVASIIQRPGIKTGIMPIIKSVEKGVGKGVFGKIVTSIIGEQYCFKTDNPQKELFGNFNMGLKDKLFVIFDESSQAVLAPMIEELKSKITESTQNINGKFRDMEESSPSFVNFVMFTNRNIAWEHNDRRPLYLCMNPRFKGNYDHFKKIDLSLRDPSFIRYLFHYFHSRDLSAFELEKDRPVTQLHRSMEARCTPIEMQFMIDFGFWKQRFIDSRTGREFTTETSIKASLLYDFYKDFTKEHKEFKPMTSTMFGNRMRELIEDGMLGIKKKHTKRGTDYCIDVKVFKEWLKSQNYMSADEGESEREMESESTTRIEVGYVHRHD